MDIASSLLPSVQAVLQILLIVLMGFLLSWRGFLPPAFLGPLGALLFDFFLPAVLFTSVVEAVTLEKLLLFWIFPVWTAVVVGSGLALSLAMAMVLRLNESQRREVVLTATFPNAGYLPLLLLPAFCRLHPAFADDPEAPQRSIAYVSVYVTVMSIALWVMATAWMRHPPKAAGGTEEPPPGDAGMEESAEDGHGSSQPKLSTPAVTHQTSGERRASSRWARALFGLSSSLSIRSRYREREAPGGAGRGPTAAAQATLPASHPPRAQDPNERSPFETVRDVDGPPQAEDGEDEGGLGAGAMWPEMLAIEIEEAGSWSGSKGGEDWETLAREAVESCVEGAGEVGEKSEGGKQKEGGGWWRGIGRWCLAVWRHPVVTNPLLACVAGLLVGIIPAVKAVLVTPNAALNWLHEGLATVGRAATPVAMIIMGAQLQASVAASRAAARGVEGGRRRSRRECVCGHCAAATSATIRLILVPALSVGFAVPLSRAGAFDGDPLLLVVMLAQAAFPGALSLILIAMRQGHDAQAMSRMLLSHYTASVVTLSFGLSFFTWLAFDSALFANV